MTSGKKDETMPTDSELLELIDHGESDRVEFTQSSHDLDKIREAICAFANDLPDHRRPGFVFVGIRDDGSGAEIVVDDQLLQMLAGLRGDGKLLPFPTMKVEKRNVKGCDVVVIQVEPSENTPVRNDGRCWIRVGPRRAQASAEEERRLTEKRKSGNLPYDMQEANKDASIENDLDVRRFKNEYLPYAVSSEVLEENDRNIKEQLRALRLITQNGTPTVTAILMVGRDPSSWFPGAYVQFIRFEGKNLTDPIQNQKQIHGTLPNQIRELDFVLEANISVSLNTSGKIHIESRDYPYEALREITRNAIIHRNYDSSNTPVRVYWFSDRVEITSPGSVFGEITRNDFGKPNVTAYRNPTIVEAMRNMGFMQKFGIGISSARKALKNNGNPPLKFDVRDTIILATVRRRK